MFVHNCNVRKNVSFIVFICHICGFYLCTCCLRAQRGCTAGSDKRSFPVRTVLGQGSSRVNQRGLSFAGKLLRRFDFWHQASGIRHQAARHKKRATPSGWPFLLVLFGGAGGNRTRVRQQSICRSTCLARSIDLSPHNPIGRT